MRHGSEMAGKRLLPARRYAPPDSARATCALDMMMMDMTMEPVAACLMIT